MTSLGVGHRYTGSLSLVAYTSDDRPILVHANFSPSDESGIGERVVATTADIEQGCPAKLTETHDDGMVEPSRLSVHCTVEFLNHLGNDLKASGLARSLVCCPIVEMRVSIAHGYTPPTDALGDGLHGHRTSYFRCIRGI